MPFLWPYKPHHGAYLCEWKTHFCIRIIRRKTQEKKYIYMYILKVSLEDNTLLRSLPYSSCGAQHCFEHLKKHQYLIKNRIFLNQSMRKLKSKETTRRFSPRLPDPHLESTVEVVRPHLLLHLISLTSFLLLFSFLNLARRLSQPAIMPIISWAWITEKVLLLRPHENDIKVGGRKSVVKARNLIYLTSCFLGKHQGSVRR